MTDKINWERKFLESLEKCGTVTVSAQHANVSASAAYRQRGKDAAFNVAWIIARGRFRSAAREKGVKGRRIRCPDCGRYMAFDDDTWYCSTGACFNELSYDLKND